MLPLVKVGVLVLRQISKPIANTIVGWARENKFFNDAVIAGARAYHRTEVNLRRRLLGLEPQSVKPLDPKQAIDVATSIMGELILFTLAGAAVAFEYSRQKDKEKAKAAELDQRFEELTTALQRVEASVKSLQEARGPPAPDAAAPAGQVAPLVLAASALPEQAAEPPAGPTGTFLPPTAASNRRWPWQSTHAMAWPS